MSLIALAVLGGSLLGMIGGKAKADERRAQFDDKLEDLNRQKSVLDLQFTQFQANDALSRDILKADLLSQNKELDLLADQTIANRDMAITQRAKTGAMQSHVDAAGIATLAQQSKQAESEANQRAAGSGFRGTGTAKNAVVNAQRAGSAALDQGRLQAAVSLYQTHATALNAYVSANQQADAYQRQMEQNEADYSQGIQRLDLGLQQAQQTYDLQGGFLASDIDYMNGEGKQTLNGAMAWDILGGMFSGGVDAYKLFG